MVTVDLIELSAKLSERLVQWLPIYSRVSKVIDKNIFEVTGSEEEATPVTFFQDDESHRILSPGEKERIFWQYHRSFHCEIYVHAVAYALKMLNDEGIEFRYEGNLVQDLRVMYLSDLDVSDVEYSRILKFIDPRRGVTVSSLNTYKNMEKLQAIDTNACNLLCFGIPHRARPGAVRQRYHNIHKDFFAPHWWIAAVVTSERLGKLQESLIHIDVCGAAYDDQAFRKHYGSLVSLWTFTTPNYELMPCESIPNELRVRDNDGMFVMLPYTSATHLREWQLSPLLQPFWMRHMRGYHFYDGSAIVVSTLERYLLQARATFSDGLDKWAKIVYKLKDRFYFQMSPFTSVTIKNCRQQPQLDGKEGCVLEISEYCRENRSIPVKLHPERNPVWLSPEYIHLHPRKQFQSYERLYNYVLERSLCESMVTVLNVSDRLFESFREHLEKDKYMKMVYTALCLRKITYKFLLDDHFTHGMRRLITNSRMLQPLQFDFLRMYLWIVDHPKGQYALNMIRDLKLGMEHKQLNGRMKGNGIVIQDEVSGYYRACGHAKARIQADYELRQVFQMIKRAGLFCDIEEHFDVLCLFEHGPLYPLNGS